MENFIHKAELANRLGISIRTLENWAAHRAFPKAYRLFGSRLVFYRISDVKAWLEEALTTSGAEE
jgi:predicted DNA-binding transcriptional regulator AlpA